MEQSMIHSSGDNAVNTGVNHGTINYIVQQIRDKRPQALKQLPRDIPNFVGRVEQLKSVSDALNAEGVEQRAVAISAVSGMGGIGKSALAIRVAHQLKASYTDAQLYVNLQGADATTSREPVEVLGELLRELGLEDAQIAPMELEARAKWWRAILAELRALVVLDNARDARQVESLLPGSGEHCAVIVTSRQVLTLEGVVPLRLAEMEPGEALELLVKVSGRTIEDRDLGLAKTIVEQCGRLPLAVKIVGALLRKRDQMTLAEAQAELEEQRQRLTALAQQHEILQTDAYLDVRSCLALSLGWLGPREQGLFGQVALIPGVDFGLAVAGAVTQQELATVRAGLDLLADEQLLEAKGAGRYQFHDLVRLLGQEQSWQGEERELEARTLEAAAAQWYFHQAGEKDDALRGKADEEELLIQQKENEPRKQTRQRLLTEALAWFHQEQENVQAVVRWASEREQWQLAQRLALLLDFFASLQGFRGDLVPLYEVALAAARQGNDRLGEANTLQATADVLQFKKRSDEALEKYDQAIAIYREVGARLGEANTLQATADVLQFKKRSDEALEKYDQAIAIYREVGARLGEANTLSALGRLTLGNGQTEQAERHTAEALAIYRKIGDRFDEAATLYNWAVSQAQQGDYWKAKTNIEQAEAIFTEIKIPHLIETCQTMLRELTQIISKTARPAPSIGEPQPAPSPPPAVAATKPSKPIAPDLTLPVWAWFLIGLGLVVLLALLFG